MRMRVWTVMHRGAMRLVPSHGSRLGTSARLLALTSAAITAMVLVSPPALADAWTQFRTPKSSHSQILRGVAATSARDAWAVGFSSTAQEDHPIILHWDGTAWSRVQTPALDGGGSLWGVRAVGPTNVWAVGGRPSGSLIEHFDGDSWSVVASPGRATLYGVAASSSSNAWAVGGGGLILHWDGSKWTRASSPTTQTLRSVALVTTSNAWAVGENTILHWNGSSWREVSYPAGTDDGLLTVKAISASNVYAAGASNFGSDDQQPLILHYNGTAWKRVLAPDCCTYDVLYSLVTISASNVWAIGTNEPPSVILSGVAYHWDGNEWTSAQIPLAHQRDPDQSWEYYGAARIPDTRMFWAVGAYEATCGQFCMNTLISRHG